MNTTRKELVVVIVSLFMQKFSVRRQDVFVHTEVWNEIFECIFGSPPSGIDDARWDSLFSTDEKNGYNAFAAATRYIDTL